MDKGTALNIAYYAYEGINYIPSDKKKPIEFFIEDPRTGIGYRVSVKQALNEIDRFKRLKAAWFIPYLKKLKRGEEIDIKELEQEIERETGRPPMWDLVYRKYFDMYGFPDGIEKPKNHKT